MGARRRTACGALAALLLCVTTMESPHGFALLAHKWPNGTVTMHLQLGGGAGTLIDGSTSWNQVATNALATWNTHVDLVKFSAVNNSTVTRGDGTDTNDVFFDSAVYGRAFGRNTLAIATSWYNTATNAKLESDVVFNNGVTWNSYRGNLRSSSTDFFRVALHEFGHTLGLDHPDENGQGVSALMNSEISNLDALTADDIAGGRSMYGAGVTSNISFPPRNEPNDFYNQLIAVYRDQLGAGQVTTYIDPEGIVVWLIEYARYRVGLCDHSTAATRVFSAIDNTGVYGVCALTPAGSIPFPPRNEGMDFMNALQVKYRDGLGRSAGSSFVDNEGAVVWVLEYLRYRLNSCSHGDATTKVFMQIRGQGIQPVCR